MLFLVALMEVVFMWLPDATVVSVGKPDVPARRPSSTCSPMTGDAADLVVSLKDQNKELVADIRRLVYELRPPALSTATPCPRTSC